MINVYVCVCARARANFPVQSNELLICNSLYSIFSFINVIKSLSCSLYCISSKSRCQTICYLLSPKSIIDGHRSRSVNKNKHKQKISNIDTIRVNTYKRGLYKSYSTISVTFYVEIN